jgi:ABC-type multidrug transport system fused ATPase/permease subunit
VRAQIGCVRQDSYLFNASVSENLLIARPGATQEQIELAAKRAAVAAG